MSLNYNEVHNMTGNFAFYSAQNWTFPVLIDCAFHEYDFYSNIKIFMFALSKVLNFQSN